MPPSIFKQMKSVTTSIAPRGIRERIVTTQEFYPSGQIKYLETILELSDTYSDRDYPPGGVRVRSDGTHFVRIMRNAKWHQDGQLAWEIYYKNNGQIHQNDRNHN